MTPPKKIDIIIQPLRTAEGTKHEYISVEWLEKKLNELRCEDARYDQQIAWNECLNEIKAQIKEE